MKWIQILQQSKNKYPSLSPRSNFSVCKLMRLLSLANEKEVQCWLWNWISRLPPPPFWTYWKAANANKLMFSSSHHRHLRVKISYFWIWVLVFICFHWLNTHPCEVTSQGKRVSLFGKEFEWRNSNKNCFHWLNTYPSLRTSKKFKNEAF